MLQFSSLYILLHKGKSSSGALSEREKDSTQQSSGTLANNNQGAGSPGDPENNPKKDNTKNSEKCQMKTPVFPSTFVKVYDDANNSKLDMLRDLKNQAVIYMWFNKITGKVYIGSAIDGQKRLSRYFMPSVLKTNSRIYKNILKYGHNSFSVSILEVLGETKSVSKSDILAREQFYLDWALKTYGLQVLNLLTVTNLSLGLKHTLETKAKIAEARLGKFHSTETRDKLSQMFLGEGNPFFGGKHTSEFLAKLKERSGIANPMFGKAKSPEFIEHMNKDRSGVNNPMYGKAKSSETLAKLRKMVWVYDVEKNYKLLGVFPTVMCTKTFHISYETLTKRLQDGKIHKGKYFCKNPLD